MDVEFIKQLATDVNNVILSTAKPYQDKIDQLRTEKERIRKAFETFVNKVEKETDNMSYEKMHPTLRMYFNHLLVNLKFAKQALKGK